MRAPDVEPERTSVHVPLRPLTLPLAASQTMAAGHAGVPPLLLSLGETLDVPSVLERALTVGCRLLSADTGALAVLGRHGQVSRIITLGPSGASGPASALEEERLFADLSADPTVRRSSVAGMRTQHPAVVVPLVVGHEPYAVLRLSRPAPFSDADVALAGMLASAAATALRNAMDYEGAQRRAAWLEASLEIEQQLLAGSDRQQVMDLIADRACHAAGADTAAIVLPVDGEEFVVEAVAGADFAGAIGRRVARAGTLSAFVMRTGSAKIVEDATSDSRLRLPSGVPSLGSGIVAPLTAAGRPLGALLIGSVPEGKEFTDVDMQLVSTFAGHAALALELARAQEDRARLAVYEDRERIALDLHDLVIQRLFASGLALQTLRRSIPSVEALGRLEEISSDLDGTIMDIRATIFGLQRTHTSPHSFRGQITDVVEAARHSLGFAPRVRFTGPIDRLVPAEVREHALAVLREGLSNVWRHARASSVTVAVTATGEDLCVEVVDDGDGVGTSSRRSGLDNLRARAERLNGSFEVGGRSGGGTRLRWRVPMYAAADPD